MVIESTHLHKYDDMCVDDEKDKNGRVVTCNRGGGPEGKDIISRLSRLQLNRFSILQG